MRRLFLAVLLGEAPPGLSHSDIIQGLALLAMLANAAYVARLLCIALILTFFPNDPAAQRQARTVLDTSTQWAGDDRLLAMSNGILGVALGASSGAATPLRPTLSVEPRPTLSAQPSRESQALESVEAGQGGADLPVVPEDLARLAG